MPAQNIIELGFNIDELTAEKKQVLDLFVDLFGKLQEYDGTKFNPLGNGGLVDLKKSLNDGATAMAAFGETAQQYNKVVTEQFQKQQAAKKSTDDLTLATQAYRRIADQLAQTQAKNNAAGGDAAEGLAVEREALKQRNAELSASAKYQLSEIGSINEAKAAVAQLIQQRNNLNAADEANVGKIQELNAAIDKNNEFIRINSSELEKQKINIGNYPTIVAILQSSLSGIQEKLEQMAAAGDQSSEAFQRLTLEQKLLQGTLDRQAAGFNNVNQALRSTKNALDAMTLAGLDNTETFEKLNVAYTEAEQKVKDLHREQAILTTDAPALTALTGIARGLGGTYALGAGAVQLFASGNEKLDKELNKLVAVMTFLQGLEEAVSALRTKNAIATALQAEATKALNFVKQIEKAIFGETTAAVAANTIAKDVNTESQIANTEGLEANAAGAELNAAAVGSVTIASEAATAATIGFRTALISTGIGAIIIGIIYGITKLVGAISDWAGADDRADATQKALTASTAEMLEVVKQLNEVYQIYGKEHIEDMQKQADLAKDAGKNQFIQLENERQITQARLDMSKKYVDQHKIDQGVVDELNDKQKVALEVLQGFEENLSKAQKAVGEDNTSENKRRVESLQTVIEQQKADTKNVVTEYGLARDALKAVTDSEQALNENRVQTGKAAAEQLAKLTADSAQRQYDTSRDHNDRILNLPTSNYDEKNTAIKANYQAEEALADAHIAAIQKEIREQTITEAAGADEIATIQTVLNIKLKKSYDDRQKLRIEERERILNAQNTVSKNNNESDAAIQEAITKDTQKELDIRLQALKANVEDKAQVIADDYALQIKLAQDAYKTDAEIQALTGERDKALVALTADTQKEIYDTVVSWGEKRLKAIEELNKTGTGGNAATTNYNNQVNDLNIALEAQTISYSKYVNEKRKLDDQYAVKKDQADVADDELSLRRIREFEQNKLAIELEFAQKNLTTAKTGGNDKDIADAQAKVEAIQAIQTKANADSVAATDKLNKDKEKLNADSVATILRAQKELKQQENALEQSTFGLATQLVDAAYEKRIINLQRTTEYEDAASAATIEAVGRSTLSTRQQAEEVAILQAQQRARDIEAKKEERQEKVAEAKFDRDVAVAKAIWAGAQAEIAAIGEYGGTPYGFAIAAVIAALTAVQVGTILAKSIPAYGEGIGIPGKGRHPGGTALVGERYKPEQVSIPGHEPFVVDKPTLIDMPADSSVMPLGDGSDLVYSLGGMAITRNAAIIEMGSRGNNNAQAWDIARWQAAQTRKALKQSQRKIVNVINIKNETHGLSVDYINRKILGKKK